MQEISPEKNMRKKKKKKNSCRLSPPPSHHTNQFSDDFFLKVKLYDQEGKLRLTSSCSFSVE